MTTSNSTTTTSLLDQYLATLAANGRNRNAPDQVQSYNTNNNTSQRLPFATANFTEDKHRIRLSLDLPGVAAEDVTVEMQRGVLVIKGTRVLRRVLSLPSSLANINVNLNSNNNTNNTNIGGPTCVRQQHKFCRRFAIDTDVVDVTRMQANLSPVTGTFVLVAPKMDAPKTFAIAVTQHDVHPTEQRMGVEGGCASIDEEEVDEIMTEEVMAAAEAVNHQVKTTTTTTTSTGTAVNTQMKPTAAPLANVVSMGSASDALDAARAMLGVRRSSLNTASNNSHHSHHHKSSMKSHLMIRRSQSNSKINKVL